MKFTRALLMTIAIVQLVLASDEEAVGRNLRYTFKDGENLPEAFFETPEPMAKRSTGRRGYPACQDGSGGMCIPEGQCAPDKKAEPIAGRKACNSGKECCYGGPVNSTTRCRDQGGECVAPPRSCGNGPQIRTGTECAHDRGEICCIWTF